MIATCLITLAGDMQVHAPCRLLLIQQIIILCPLNSMEIIKLLQCWGKSGHPYFLGNYRI